MTEAAKIALNKFEELSGKLSAGISDPSNYAELMKEYSRLEPVAQKAKELEKAEKNQREALEILSSKDNELKEMAQEELSVAKEQIENLTNELTELLIPRDPNDEKPCIVEIRAGTGGEEAALFAGSLFRMYSMFCEKNNFKIDIINENETELGGYKEISFEVTGDCAYSKFKYEKGTHRVQRVPETESQGRIQTSAVTVAVLPETEDVKINIDPNDLRIDVFRSSGAGGQHINKTSSAIRITHIPTGLVVECQDERSQFKNRDKAMRVLKTRLQNMADTEQHDKIAGERKSQVGSGDRSERIRTYNFPQGRVTDHRINLTLYKIDAVMNGDLDELINALASDERAKNIAN